MDSNEFVLSGNTKKKNYCLAFFRRYETLRAAHAGHRGAWPDQYGKMSRHRRVTIENIKNNLTSLIL